MIAAFILALLLWPGASWAFDMGFDFRGTSGYVTDPAYGVPVLGEAYPHTYTNANGDSINAGWDSINIVDRVSTNDPRIAGINYSTLPEQLFTIDLSSGSNPGTGSYTLDLAMGDAGSANKQNFAVKDTTTMVIDGTNGPGSAPPGHYYQTLTGEFVDATLTTIAASTTWTGTQVSGSFATTTARLYVNPGSLTGVVTTAAHFRMAKASAAATGPPQRTMTGVGL